jgi:hypothetical protein
MKDTEIVNAKIAYTMLGYEDHGIMSCYLTLEGDVWACNYGGYALDQYDKEKRERFGTADGFNAIISLMKTLDVEKWEDLKGQFVRVESEGWGGGIVRIGHLMKDQWFSFEDFFNEKKGK